MDNNWTLSPTNDKDNDHMLLNQLESHLYDGSHKDEFNLDNLNFMLPDELNVDQRLTQSGQHNQQDQHNQQLFQYQHQQPHQQPLLSQLSPQSHRHYHHQNHHQHSQSLSDYYPESSAAFPPSKSVSNTPNIMANKSHLSNKPMFSPVLPGQNDKSYNRQHYYHTNNRSSNFIDHLSQLNNHIKPETVFSPLVSPSVTPLETGQKHTNPIQASFEPLTSPALNAEPSDKRRPSSSPYTTIDDKKSYKRRTPHGTPILQSNNQKTKRSPSISFDKLPESSFNQPNSAYSVNSNGATNATSSSSTTPMLPPQTKKLDKLDGDTSNTSPQIMGFTMGKLAQQQSNDELSQRSSLNSSPDDSPNSNKSLREKPPAKKASHKLAEQGRRNRMNTAVQALGTLIPQNYHDQVAIPSKATTVELASKYIEDLVNEIDDLKRHR